MTEGHTPKVIPYSAREPLSYDECEEVLSYFTEAPEHMHHTGMANKEPVNKVIVHVSMTEAICDRDVEMCVYPHHPFMGQSASHVHCAVVTLR